MFESGLIRLQQQEDKPTRGETQKYMQTGNLFGKLGMLAHLVLSIISFVFFETLIFRANYMSWAGPWLARLVQAKMTVQPGILAGILASHFWDPCKQG